MEPSRITHQTKTELLMRMYADSEKMSDRDNFLITSVVDVMARSDVITAKMSRAPLPPMES